MLVTWAVLWTDESSRSDNFIANEGCGSISATNDNLKKLEPSGYEYSGTESRMIHAFTLKSNER